MLEKQRSLENQSQTDMNIDTAVEKLDFNLVNSVSDETLPGNPAQIDQVGSDYIHLSKEKGMTGSVLETEFEEEVDYYFQLFDEIENVIMQNNE